MTQPTLTSTPTPAPSGRTSAAALGAQVGAGKSAPMERPKDRPNAGRSRPAWMSRSVVNVVLIIAVAYALLPQLWLVMAATKDLGDLFGTNGFAPGTGFNLDENLRYLVQAQDGIYLRWLANTVLYAGGGALAASVLCVMAGYAFDKLEVPGREAVFGLVLVGVMIPSTALALPTYLLASKVGLANTFLGVFIPGLVFPFGVYLARIFSASYVPDAVIGASRVDGAGELRTFWSVAFPMMRPGFVTILLFQFTAIWNSFFLPLVMLSDARLYPVNLGLYVWNTTAMSQGKPEDYLLAITGSLVAIVPLVLLFLALQRFWRAGMTAGAID